MPHDTKAIVAQIDSVLARRAELRKLVPEQRDANFRREDFAELHALYAAAIERLTPRGSQYQDQMRTALSDASRSEMMQVTFLLSGLNRLEGILKAVRADYEGSRLQNFQELIHSELFSDFLEMAEYLLDDEGYKDPAAVLAGGVLEQHLRKLCAKHGVTLPAKPKLDAMNADLAKQNAYGKNEQKQITAWAGLRNDAAHGDFAKYTAEQVRLMIQGIRHFITCNPA